MENLDLKVQDQLHQARNVHDVQGLDSLRKAAKAGDKEALHEAAKQFEGIFVRMMLKSMRAASDVLSDSDSPFNSEQVKFYRDMHDQQMASDLAANGSIGLADIIVQQLGQDIENFRPASVLRNDANLSSINRKRAQQTASAQDFVLGPKTMPANKQAAFDSPEEFVSQLLPHAEKVAKELGIDARALVAQAALETGWGQKMIHMTDGSNSHNLFGIKADKRWQGDKAVVNTLEYEDGIARTEKAPFRAYPSFTESMRDYVSFVKENPRYQQALDNAGDSSAYFDALQKAGYATDPLYAKKVLSVLNSETFARFMQGNPQGDQAELFSAPSASE
ncbi:flagellar assembly peptidoglycan hydrolase FlgJ [Aliiglaciecola sp. CAU 1673]|uniref:flagellar assembly peptidoglycan hydrolase FlgJ n=1 Tax=Aliiglaciecola sp. CAU 1673 TaxID=3032595 RepID=UPI0023DBDF1C|nr:flagellar assembly peptidoglycan hydrolase FlgJ [Aliiglaciecola sp. CAU 1673]MDF2178320.1 flagellar assembly peptidoglycan hydrolase FlgJ [Aliiglaciecola sp. CAU 1673]